RNNKFFFIYQTFLSRNNCRKFYRDGFLTTFNLADSLSFSTVYFQTYTSINEWLVQQLCHHSRNSAAIIINGFPSAKDKIVTARFSHRSDFFSYRKTVFWFSIDSDSILGTNRQCFTDYMLSTGVTYIKYSYSSALAFLQLNCLG